jgi:hypothetical protein
MRLTVYRGMQGVKVAGGTVATRPARSRRSGKVLYANMSAGLRALEEPRLTGRPARRLA